MKKEELTAMGVNDETADNIIAAYAKEIDPLNAASANYQKQLKEAQDALKAMEGIDVKELQGKIAKLTADLADKEKENAQIKADYAFDALVKEAIQKANGRSEKAIRAFLDVDTLKASKNQEADIAAALEAVKKENGFLFVTQKPATRIVGGTSGINNDAQSAKAKANEALRSIMGR